MTAENTTNGTMRFKTRTCPACGSDALDWGQPPDAYLARLRDIESLAKQLVDAIRDGNRPNRNEAEAILTEMLS